MKPKTAKPMIAGALLIVAAIISIINWGLILSNPSLVGIFAILGLGGLLAVCGAIGIIVSIIALLGGVMAYQRKMWGLALVGSILGLFTIGFLGISSLLSFIALILVAISRNEF